MRKTNHFYGIYKTNWHNSVQCTQLNGAIFVGVNLPHSKQCVKLTRSIEAVQFWYNKYDQLFDLSIG